MSNSTGGTTDFIVNGATTLSGSGKVVLSDAGTRGADRVYSNQGGTTLDNQVTIEGAGEIFSNGNLRLVNNSTGVVDATGTHALAIHDIGVVNMYILEATGSGGLSIWNAGIDNTASGTTNSGKIKADGGDVYIGQNVGITGGTLSSSSGYEILSVSGGSTLNGVAIAAGSVVGVANGDNLTLNGAIDNAGQIQLDDTNISNTDMIANGYVTLKGGGAVVMADDGTVHANRIYSNQGGSTLDNQERIEGAGEIFSNGNLRLVNDTTGVIDATGTHALGIHDIGVVNRNVLEATGSGGLSIWNAGMDNTAGGTTNSGQIKADGGDVYIGQNVEITGGTLSSSSGYEILSVSGGSTLNGVAIAAGSVVGVANGDNLTLNGAIDNAGQIQLDDTNISNTDLIANGYVTLKGGGAVVMADDGTVHANRIYSNWGGSTLDNQETIGGAGEIYSNGNLRLVNDTTGVIDATGTHALAIHDIGVVNKNVLEATGSGGLSIWRATIDNTDGGATDSGATDSGATDSGATDSGQIEANGGDVVIYDGVGVIGGTLSSAAGFAIVEASTGSTLNGTGSPVVVSKGSVFAVANGANISIQGVLDNQGTFELNDASTSNTDFIANGAVTIEGGGSLVLSDSSTIHGNRIYSNWGGSTLDNQETIEGAGEIYSNGNLRLVNDTTGVIAATKTHALAIHDIGVVNRNVLEATGSGGLSIWRATIDNTDSGANDSGQIEANGGDVVIYDGVGVIGGTLSSAAGSVIVEASTGSTLNGTGSPVVVSRGSVFAVANGANISVQGVLDNQGTFELNNSSTSNTDFIANGAVTLKGGGSLVLSDSATIHGNRIFSNWGGSTLDNQETIEGAGEIFSNGNLSLVNDTTGVIAATGTHALAIHDISFANKGAVIAENGATLLISNALQNLSNDASYANGLVLTGGSYEAVEFFGRRRQRHFDQRRLGDHHDPRRDRSPDRRDLVAEPERRRAPEFAAPRRGRRRAESHARRRLRHRAGLQRHRRTADDRWRRAASRRPARGVHDHGRRRRPYRRRRRDGGGVRRARRDRRPPGQQRRRRIGGRGGPRGPGAALRRQRRSPGRRRDRHFGQFHPRADRRVRRRAIHRFRERRNLGFGDAADRCGVDRAVGRLPVADPRLPRRRRDRSRRVLGRNRLFLRRLDADGELRRRPERRAEGRRARRLAEPRVHERRRHCRHARHRGDDRRNSRTIRATARTSPTIPRSPGRRRPARRSSSRRTGSRSDRRRQAPTAAGRSRRRG